MTFVSNFRRALFGGLDYFLELDLSVSCIINLLLTRTLLHTKVRYDIVRCLNRNPEIDLKFPLKF